MMAAAVVIDASEVQVASAVPAVPEV